MHGSKRRDTHPFVTLAMVVTLAMAASPLVASVQTGTQAGTAYAAGTFWDAPSAYLSSPSRGKATSPVGDAARPAFQVASRIAPAVQGPTTSSAAKSGTHLTFRYAKGWSTAERADIASFIATAYPVMVDVVGPPARSYAITLVPDDSLNGWAYFRWSACGGRMNAEIHVGHADLADPEGRLFYLPHEILHAFHAPFTLPTNAGEEGLTEAASATVRALVAPLIGVEARPAEPEVLTYNGRAISALVGADELNQAVLAAPSFHNRNGRSRPQVSQMYSAAAIYWLTLAQVRPTVFRDFNARWYKAAPRAGTPTAAAKAVQAIVASLVPRVGTRTYAAWRSQQQIMRTRHPAGLSLLCTNIAPQLDSATGDARIILAPTLIETAANGDDRDFEGPVAVTIVGPDGMTVSMRSGDATPNALFSFGNADVPAPGAYRFLVTAQASSRTSTTQGCWAIAGVASAHSLLVIGTPGSAVTATFSVLDAGTGSVAEATFTQAVPADGIAVFEGVEPGLAEVGPAGARPSKTVPVGEGGAIVALIPAEASLPTASH